MKDLSLIGYRFYTICEGELAIRRETRKLRCEFYEPSGYENGCMVSGNPRCYWKDDLRHPAREDECCDTCFKRMYYIFKMKEFKKSMARLRREIRTTIDAEASLDQKG